MGVICWTAVVGGWWPCRAIAFASTPYPNCVKGVLTSGALRRLERQIDHGVVSKVGATLSYLSHVRNTSPGVPLPQPLLLPTWVPGPPDHVVYGAFAAPGPAAAIVVSWSQPYLAVWEEVATRSMETMRSLAAHSESEEWNGSTLTELRGHVLISVRVFHLPSAVTASARRSLATRVMRSLTPVQLWRGVVFSAVRVFEHTQCTRL